MNEINFTYDHGCGFKVHCLVRLPACCETGTGKDEASAFLDALWKAVKGE